MTADDDVKSSASADGKQAQLDEEDSEIVVVHENKNMVGFWSTVLNLLNSLIGAGILVLPSAFRYVGLIPSIIVMSVIALLADIGAELTIRLQLETNALGFDSTVTNILGRKGQVLLSLSILVFLTSGLIGFLNIGTTFAISWLKLAFKNSPTVIENIDKFGPRALLVFVYWLLIPGALSIPRQLKILSYSSYVNIVCIIFFLFAICYEAARYLGKPSDFSFNFPDNRVDRDIRKGVSFGKFGVGVFQAISLYSLTFSIPVCIIPLFVAYERNLKSRIRVSRVGTTLCCIIVMIPAILGYLTFGDQVSGIILDTFPDDDVVIIISRVCFMLVVTGSYVMLTQPVMGSWAELIFKENDPSTLPTKQRWIVLALANIPTVFISMVYKDATNVLNIGGALGGNVISFCFPPVMWIKYFGQPLSSKQNIWCIVFCAFGCIVAAISTILSFIDFLNFYLPENKQIVI